MHSADADHTAQPIYIAAFVLSFALNLFFSPILS